MHRNGSAWRVAGCALGTVSLWSSPGALRSPQVPTNTVSTCSPRCCQSSLLFALRFVATPSRICQQSWSRNALRPWMCAKENCRAVNPATRTQCESCGTDKPKLMGWKCVKCGARNHRGVKRCKECQEPHTSSQGFWMCAACGENNRIDEIEDNSRCGHCGYDMAPLSKSEEEIAQIHQRREEMFHAQQERFDSVSAQDAAEQFGDPQHGAESLSPQLRAAAPVAVRSEAAKKLDAIPEIAPFRPKPIENRHSRLYRKPAAAGTEPLLANADVVPPGPPGFDWMCRDATCGQINPGDEENCLKCGVHITPAEWECPQCAALNHLSRSRCFNCHTGIPVSWTCPACQTTTSVYDKVCRSCHEPRPPAEPRLVADVRAEALDSNRSGEVQFRKNDWYCESCNGLNFSRRTDCFQCGAPRSNSAGRGPGPRQGNFAAPSFASNDAFAEPSQTRRVAEQNNWICHSCQASNFRTRRTCWQCGKETTSPLAGRSAEDDASVPHFEKEGFQDSAESKPAEGRMNVWQKTDDWVCAKCFSKNFRGKSECFKCGSPRALAVTPRRASVRKPVKL